MRRARIVSSRGLADGVAGRRTYRLPGRYWCGGQEPTAARGGIRSHCLLPCGLYCASDHREDHSVVDSARASHVVTVLRGLGGAIERCG